MGYDLNAFKGVDYNAVVANAKESNGDSNLFSIDRDRLEKDKKIWYVIRFLPYEPGKDPILRVSKHSIMGGTKEQSLHFGCPSTVGQKCPICEESKKYFYLAPRNDKNHPAFKVGSMLYKKKLFYANILIVNDPYNPENNGKVKVMKFGSQLHQVIDNAISPTVPTIAPARPFDIFAGNNCNLVVVYESGQPKYSYSTFDPNFTSVASADVMDQVTNLEEKYAKPEFYVLDDDIVDQINNTAMRVLIPFNMQAVDNVGAQPTYQPQQVQPPTYQPPTYQPQQVQPQQVQPPTYQPQQVQPPTYQPQQVQPPQQPANNKTAEDVYNESIKKAKEEESRRNIEELDDLIS